MLHAIGDTQVGQPGGAGPAHGGVRARQGLEGELGGHRSPGEQPLGEDAVALGAPDGRLRQGGQEH